MIADYIVYIQGNEPDEWLPAEKWQKDMYIELYNEIMRSAQSSALYGPIESPVQKNGPYLYKIKINESWSSTLLININTRRIRNMKILMLPTHTGAVSRSII
jgi:hypothetical protein